MPVPFQMETPAGRVLHGTVTRADRPGQRPPVVISHGFKGFQEWCFLPYIAELLAARGFAAVRFNYSGSGMRPGDPLVTDLEAFRTATLTKDLEELSFLIEHIDEIDPDGIDPRRVGLFGHSRGGGVSVLASALEEHRERIAALVTWAAVATFDRASPGEKSAWRQAGGLPLVNARTGQQLEVDVQVLDDVEANAERLDVRRAATELAAPWLIVHGTQDETVPAAESHQLETAAGPDCERLEISGAGHTFGVGHPFSGPSRELIAALNATQVWFRRHLA